MKLRFMIIFVSLFVVYSCKNQSKKQVQPPKAPKINEIDRSRGNSSNRGKLHLQNKKIKPLMSSEDITCEGACNQLAYCNKKILDQENSDKKIKLCSKTCHYDTTPTGKAKWKSIFECLKKYRGEQCKELRTCMETKLKQLQMKFHNQNK